MNFSIIKKQKAGIVMYNNNELILQETSRKQHILIVDDNSMILRNIKAILNDYFEVSVAPSGKHAFRSIEENKPNLILLDYEMPEMNGKDVFLKLSSDENLKGIPVVFLTGIDSRQRVLELLALKPAGYILKPVNPDELMEKIRGILRK